MDPKKGHCITNNIFSHIDGPVNHRAAGLQVGTSGLEQAVREKDWFKR